MTEHLTSVPELCHLPGCHEPFSAFSHMVGAVVFLVLGGLLLHRGRGNPARLAFLGVYAFACVFLFSMSTGFHMLVRGETSHRVLERLDHSAIFVLVAGTFTPIHGILLTGWQRWVPLAVVWTGAVAGIVLKAVFFDDVPPWLGVTLYLALGWTGVFGGVLLVRRFGFWFVRLPLLGGLAYSLGAVLDHFGWVILIPGFVHPHDLFHLAVLVAALLHWRFIWQIAGDQEMEKPQVNSEQACAAQTAESPGTVGA